MNAVAFDLSPRQLVQDVIGGLKQDPPPDLWRWACDRLVMHDGTRFSESRALILKRWYRRTQARILRQPIDGDPYAHRAETLALVAASAFAKSTWLHVGTLWCQRYRPRRAAFYARRRGDVGQTRKSRLQPMIEKTPDLAAVLPDTEEERTKALAADLWMFNGGRTWFRCATVLDDWRQEHFELLNLDEVARFPEKVEDLNPMGLRHGRQRPYRRTKLCQIASAPLRINDHSWQIACEGSHERVLVVCPSCLAMDWLDPRHLVLAPAPGSTDPRDLDQASDEEIVRMRLARWRCPWCGSLHDDAAIRDAVAIAARDDTWCPGTWYYDDAHPTGAWLPQLSRDSAGRPTEGIPPAEGFILSGQISALYSDTVSLTAFLLETKKGLSGKRTQAETVYSDTWGEPYIAPPAESITVDELNKKAAAGTTYHRGRLDFVPTWIVLVMDQQANRPDLFWFPWVCLAVQPGGHTWRIDAGRGDARDLGRSAAKALTGTAVRDAIVDKLWDVGTEQRVADYVVMDCANGNFLKHAYTWAAGDPGRRILVRGSDSLIGTGIPWEEAPRSRRKGRARPEGVEEYRFDPSFWCDELWDQLLHKPGMPRWTAPDDMPEFYTNSLVSEAPHDEERRVAGEGRRLVRIWEPRSYQDKDDNLVTRSDNHWFRCEVMGAVFIDIKGMSSDDEPAADPLEQDGGGGGGDGWTDDVGGDWADIGGGWA